jgi:predicted NAD-dependent protein-ADP-ribosyltransferase YbiA (DUF1768 family)
VKFFAADGEFGALSNFFLLPDPVSTPLGFACATSEHLYHALKYDFDGAPEANIDLVKLIVSASTPYKAKVIANAYRGGPSRYAWQRTLSSQARVLIDAGATPRPDIDVDSVRIDMMRRCLRAKFKRNSQCRKLLLSTYPSDLVEASPYDTFWGVGRRGDGQNHLGTLLMDLREQLRRDSLSRLGVSITPGDL